MRRTRIVVEWDEASAMGLAEAVWDAGGTVRVLAEGALHLPAPSTQAGDASEAVDHDLRWPSPGPFSLPE